tara:strand:- start:718 stop:1581 length:864 start_codon:yes stop_codon:yes gene_type:complete
MNNFAAFILSHGRPNNVKTYTTLRNSGYTGKIYILIDDQDKYIEEYKKQYGDEVIIFDKLESKNLTDSFDNFPKMNSVIYARNKNFEIAKEMGLDFFIQLDDDYSSFGYAFDHNGEYVRNNVKTVNLDKMINYSLDFLIDSGADSVAFSQGGDFIGGEGSGVAKDYLKGKIRRKVMNSFICSTKKPFSFMGRMNDDVNTYMRLGNIGKLFFTIAPIRLEQQDTQASVGGLTEMYLEMGTYVKSFYTVMVLPSCTSIREMGVANKRLHHSIKWKYAVPMILKEDLRKP